MKTELMPSGRKSLGRYAVEWMGFWLIHGEGDLLGNRYQVLPWFQDFLMQWYELHPDYTHWLDHGGKRPDNVWWHDEGLVGLVSGASKTESFAALAVFEMNAARGWDGIPKPFHRRTPIITMLAASFDQAGELFRQAQLMCGGEKSGQIDSAPLRGRFNVMAKEILYADGRPGRIVRVAAESATAEGGKETLLLADEVHEHTGEKARVYTVRSKSMTKRKKNAGRAVGMSTAGRGRGAMPAADDDPLLWRMYVRMLLEKDDPEARSLLMWIGVGDDFVHMRPDPNDDPETAAEKRRVIREALERMAGADITWSVETRFKELISGKIPWFEGLRYYANLYVLAGAESWLANIPGRWESCENPEEAKAIKGEHVAVGVDMALSHDSGALVIAHLTPEGNIGWEEKHYPPVNGRVDQVGMFTYIQETLAEEYDDITVVYDPRFMEIPARLLEDSGIRVVEFRQSIERLVQADGLMWELLVAEKIRHSGAPVFNSHAAAAGFRESDGGRYLAKSKSTGHIDLIRAASMATHELMSELFDGDPVGAIEVDEDETFEEDEEDY